jgi:adenylate kinase
VVRTEPQAAGLQRVLRELGTRLDAVLTFDVPDEELVKRLSGRTVCDNCQTPYTGREPGTKCEKCGGTLVRRKDDEPEAVRNRLSVYQRQTAPVINWYQNDGARLVSIDAVGTTDAVLNRALNALGR